MAAMAGTPAGLPAGVRLSDHISLGVIARAVPPARVRQVLAETGRAGERERDLPAPVMVYYAIALALYMGSSTREVLRCLLEGLRWLWGAEAVKVAGKSGEFRPAGPAQQLHRFPQLRHLVPQPGSPEVEGHGQGAARVSGHHGPSPNAVHFEGQRGIGFLPR